MNKALESEAARTSPVLVSTMNAWKELYDSRIWETEHLEEA